MRLSVHGEQNAHCKLLETRASDFRTRRNLCMIVEARVRGITINNLWMNGKLIIEVNLNKFIYITAIAITCSNELQANSPSEMISESFPTKMHTATGLYSLTRKRERARLSVARW